MFKLFRSLTFIAVAAVACASSASAIIAVQVFTFNGECTDCTGTGTATLILQAGYILGTELSADDLVSFNYTSNLIPDLSIHGDPTEVLTGILPVGLGSADISISGANGSFTSDVDGTWSALDPLPADVGTGGIWTSGSASPTPEPATLSMLGIGLLGLIVFAGRFRSSGRAIAARGVER